MGLVAILFLGTLILGMIMSMGRPRGGIPEPVPEVLPAPAVAPRPAPAPVARQAPPAPVAVQPPAPPPVDPIQIGDAVEVDLPGSTHVWLSTGDAWDEMLDAQNARSYPLINRLIDQGRVMNPLCRTRGIVVKNAAVSRLVRLTEGPFAGREGWIQREFVRIYRPSDEGESRRRDIYLAAWQAGMWATKQAEARFPLSQLGQGEAGLKARQDYYLGRQGAALGVVAANYGISREDLDRIEEEGTTKKWPVFETPVLFDPSAVPPAARAKKQARPRRRR